MKAKSTFSHILFVMALTIATAVAVVAQAPHDHDKAPAVGSTFLGMGDGVTTCAVTGEELHNKSINGTFHGRTVYFCCPGCLAKATKNPELYIKATAEEQAAAAKPDSKFLGKGDGIETCPVTGEPVKKDLKGEVKGGRVFYVCCEGCIETVQKNPELYLKPEKSASRGSEFLGKGDGVTTCPVTGEPISKEVNAVINGQTIYACCAGCIDTIKKNPDLYLKKN